LPLVVHHEFEEGGGLAVWRYDEPSDFFQERIIFNAYDEAQLASISHPDKQREWLASRYMVRFLVGHPEAIEMDKDEFGRPRLRNVSGYVSLSHCKQYASAIYHPKKRVGVDVEPYGPTVKKIAHKFLFPKELKHIEGPNELDFMLLYWSAKETLYKLHGKKGLAFRERILIAPFQIEDQGLMCGRVTEVPEMQQVDIRFEKQDWGYLTWALL
jgi:phosphopantetheinyl transferase